MLSVGQKLWYVPYFGYGRGEPQEVVVEKVGRRWAYTEDQFKVDINTLIAQQGNMAPVGKCYLSRQEYEEERTLYRAWIDFRNLIIGAYRPPKEMSLEKITLAKTVLGL